MVSRRVFLIVLDSYGIGELPDAALFGDEGCNTLRTITKSKEYDTPWMKKMGLFNIDGIDYVEGVAEPLASYGRLAETSKGKDTTIEYTKGANETLKLAKLFNVKKALLKAKSPSCGNGKIYDGTFSGVLVDGDGITTKILKENDIEVITIK